MKEKILAFIMGFLLGAIITTSGFLIYSKTVLNNSNEPGMMQMNEKGQNGGQQPGSMQEPPEKPDGDNEEQPPTKPEEVNNNTNN